MTTEYTQWRSMVDEQAYPALPDSGLVHDWDVTELSLSDGEEITAVPDQVGENDLTGSGAVYRENGINGNPSAEFDGVDALLRANTVQHDGNFTYFVVYESFDSSRRHYPINEDLENNAGMRYGQRDGEYEYAHSGEFTDTFSTATTNPEIAGMRRSDGESADISVNDGEVTQTSSSSAYTTSSGDFGIDSDAELGDDPFEGYIGRILAYDAEQSNEEFSESFDTLANQFDIQLA